MSFKCESLGSELNQVKARLEECVSMVKNWMTSNLLKLNDKKTEMLIVHSSKLSHCIPENTNIRVGSSSVGTAESVRNLGTMFDCNFTMEKNINRVIKTSFGNIKKIYKMRKYITIDATKLLAINLILSHLDYTNSLYQGLPKSCIKRLQRVQNAAARMVFNVSRDSDASELIAKLHWLPVNRRIEYKVLVLIYKAITGQAPKYISNMLIPYRPPRPLRSEEQRKLVPGKGINVRISRRRFSCAGPELWNALPLQIRLAQTVSSFKKQLKTHLFRLQ